jgi:hypothetical protein
MSYYEKRLTALIEGLVASDLVTRAEIESGHPEKGGAKLALAVSPADAVTALFRIPATRRNVAVAARFQPGQEVRARNIWNPLGEAHAGQGADDWPPLGAGGRAAKACTLRTICARWDARQSVPQALRGRSWMRSARCDARHYARTIASVRASVWAPLRILDHGRGRFPPASDHRAKSRFVRSGNRINLRSRRPSHQSRAATPRGFAALVDCTS